MTRPATFAAQVLCFLGCPAVVLFPSPVAGENNREPALILRQTGYVFTVAFGHDAKYIASAGKERSIILWDAATGKRLRRFSGETPHHYSLAFHPTRSHIAVA